MTKAAKSLFKVVLGLLLLIVPIYLFAYDPWNWQLWQAVWTLIKGGVAILVLLIGLIFVLVGFSDLK